jgi:hypothetical protein
MSVVANHTMSAVPLAQIQSSNTLLDYSLTTAPAPLQVSADATHPSMGSLTIVVSNSGDDVTLASLEISLPVGTPSAPEGADLTEVGAGIAGSSSDPAWQVTYPGKTNGILYVKPASGSPIVIGDQGIAITITNIQVSTEPGTAFVTIAETATVTATGATITGKPEIVLAVPKFPTGFAAGNFSIAAPVVANGATSTMTWFGTQGAGYTYTILWTGAPVDVSTVQTWTSPPLTDITTFLLEVQATTPNGPVKLWFSSTQIVSTPSIVAETLQVTETSVLEGLVTANEDLAVGGTATAAVLTATSSVGAPSAAIGTAQLGTIDVATAAVFGSGSTIGGAVGAQGAAIAALTNAVGIQPGSYQPNTDGFIAAVVSCPSNTDRQNLCNTTIFVSANGAGLSAMGGNAAAMDSGQRMWWMPNYGSILLPVSKGSVAQISVYNDPSNQVNAPVGFAFIPLGSAQGEALIARLSDDQAPDPGHHAVRAD